MLAGLVAGALVATPAAARGGAGGGGGGTGGGGGGGGGGTTCDTTPVLPAFAPFPDIVVRESFGFAAGVRPAGGNGCNKPYLLHNSIAGYWVEYPGSKNSVWLAAPEPETWRVCAWSGDPYEMPSPLQQGDVSSGCLISDWFDPPVTRPTALMPFTQPATAYQLSVEAWPAPIGGNHYLGFGLTDNSVTDSNLETSGGVWIELNSELNSFVTSYVLHSNGRTGPVLASGTTAWSATTRLAITYDPRTKVASASIEGMDLGSFPVDIKTPRFIGLEGVGQVDNLVVRQLP